LSTSSLVKFPPLSLPLAATASTPGKPIRSKAPQTIVSSPKKICRIYPAVAKGKISEGFSGSQEKILGRATNIPVVREVLVSEKEGSTIVTHAHSPVPQSPIGPDGRAHKHQEVPHVDCQQTPPVQQATQSQPSLLGNNKTPVRGRSDDNA